MKAKFEKLETVYVVAYISANGKSEWPTRWQRSTFLTRAEAKRSIESDARPCLPTRYHIVKFVRAGRQ